MTHTIGQGDFSSKEKESFVPGRGDPTEKSQKGKEGTGPFFAGVRHPYLPSLGGGGGEVNYVKNFPTKRRKGPEEKLTARDDLYPQSRTRQKKGRFLA